RVNQLQAVEFERNVRRGACGNQTARAVRHLESPAANDEIVLRVGEVSELKVREGLLQVDRILLHRRRRPFTAELQARNPLHEKPYVLVQVQIATKRDALKQVVIVPGLIQQSKAGMREVLKSFANFAAETQISVR